MMRRTVFVWLLLLGLHGFARNEARERSFDGEISDSQCGFNVHSLGRSHEEMMKTGNMGKTPAECAAKCVGNMGGQFVFVSSNKKNAYKVEPQDLVKDFAGQRVIIQGNLVNGLIHVSSVKPL
jgi:hypothetical protein